MISLLSPAIAVVALALVTVEGYYDYHARLPNSQHVPHPCKPNFLWHGLGHLNPMGGGERNQFGKDFARLGHKWGPDLCHLDSDGDGLTNGQELGDPGCTWTPGSVPARTVNITHPGICDPWDSDACHARNTWVSCDAGVFSCNATHDPDVRSIELRFPRTPVPPVDTTYICFAFDLPSDQAYHMIAYEPIIDNRNVMHHMVATVCDETGQLMDSPTECSMGVSGCRQTTLLWTLGMTGTCYNREVGFRIGKGGPKRMVLQFHWTNVHHVDGWFDSSGMKIYYTSQLRANDAGVLTVGQVRLDIPPGKPSIVEAGSCSSDCTSSLMSSPIKIVSALSHMHYLGIAGKSELIRNGSVVQVITEDNPYSYDSPTVHEFPTPIQVLPGDEVKMICEYNSMSRKNHTSYGLGSYEEMCFSLITYYPKQSKIEYCAQDGHTDQCKYASEYAGNNDFGKRAAAALNESIPETAEIFRMIFKNCNLYGSCVSTCPGAIAEARRRNPIYGGNDWEVLKQSLWDNLQMNYARLLRLIAAFDSCERVPRSSCQAN